nr:AraC family transcriptional regulator [Fibrella forsythiae]
MSAFDGNTEYSLQAGDYGLAVRNGLAKYSKQPDQGRFEKVVIFFDQAFLKAFQVRYAYASEGRRPAGSLVKLTENRLVHHFVQSLTPYLNGDGIIRPEFSDIKRSELLVILLNEQPALASILFNFGHPEKINLEQFMNLHYTFNVSIERFAYLTGRSLSAFKRDFEQLFHETPSRWLVKKRLQEAYFQLERNGKKPSEIYLDLGFEDLSHFSYAFRKQFGHSPSTVAKRGATTD